MTEERALDILKLYRHWNTCRVGMNEHEEKILKGCRALVMEAQNYLARASSPLLVSGEPITEILAGYGQLNDVCTKCGQLLPPLRPEKEADRQPTQDEAARHPEHGTSPKGDEVCANCGHTLSQHDWPKATVSHFCAPCLWPTCAGCGDFTAVVSVPQDPHPIGDKAAEPSAVSSSQHAEPGSSAGSSPSLRR